MSWDFKINEYDKCVYVKDAKRGYVIVCLYVDDMLIVSSDDKMITSIKNMLNSRFDLKDLGLVDVILEIKTKRIFVIMELKYFNSICGVLILYSVNLK